MRYTSARRAAPRRAAAQQPPPVTAITLEEFQRLYVLQRDAIDEAGVAGAPRLLKEVYLMLRAAAGRDEGEDFQSVLARYRLLLQQKQQVWRDAGSGALSVGQAHKAWALLSQHSGQVLDKLGERCTHMRMMTALPAHSPAAPLPGGLVVPRQVWRFFDDVRLIWPDRVAEEAALEDRLDTEFVNLLNSTKEWLMRQVVSEPSLCRLGERMLWDCVGLVPCEDSNVATLQLKLSRSAVEALGRAKPG